MPVAVLVHLRHFYRDHHHHHHHHHHHYCSLYLCNDQKIWITTKIHIFTKGFKHIECGRFLRDHAGFHEHNEPRVVLYKLWHDLINSHKVTKHACTFSCLPLATQCTTYTMTLQLWTNNKTNKSYKQLIYIYINISCKCDTNRAGHLTLDAYASKPVACLYIFVPLQYVLRSHRQKSPFRQLEPRIIVSLYVWIVGYTCYYLSKSTTHSETTV